ncbi:MAG TPA: hypothetical protein VFT45_12090 [Longimicrobium sp.]|nr:hypothetical protein [Longimicrobium sp.]
MTAAEAWVRGRLAGSPPALLDAMLAALPADDALQVPDALAEGALAIYAQLLAGGAGADRDDALPLLAADALFTHALQAQAEADPDGVPALAERIGASGALAGLTG